MKLVTKAKRLTAALDLGQPRTNSGSTPTVVFAGEFTLPVLRRKFRPTTFKFDSKGFRFVDKANSMEVLLHGEKMHRTENRFVTFHTELAQLA